MMRKRWWIAVFVLCLAHDGNAQAKNELTFFASNSDVSARAFRDLGVAFTRAWTPRISTQIAVSKEDPEVCVGGSFLERECTRAELRTYPIDIMGRYHFQNDTRWIPYVGIGVRYVSAPTLTPHLIAEIGHEYPDHIDPQFVGGVQFLVSDSLGITVEAKHRLANSDAFDPLLKVSAGLTLRF